MRIGSAKSGLAGAGLVSAFATAPSPGAPPTVFLSFWQNGGPPSYSLNRTVTVDVQRPQQHQRAGPSGGLWSATEYRIDADCANPLAAWQAMGSPAHPSAEQVAQLATAGEAGKRAVQVTDEGTVTIQMSPNSAVVLVFANS